MLFRTARLPIDTARRARNGESSAICAAIQKKGSFTWQIAIDPAPTDAAASARPVALSSPSAGSTGSTMPEAVSTALSELPWRVFTMAAARNGASRPSLGSITDSANSSDMPVSSSTRAKPPAAPTVSSKGAQRVSASTSGCQRRDSSSASAIASTARISGRLMPV